jgi:uncharacterized protein (TIGR03118 family)
MRALLQFATKTLLVVSVGAVAYGQHYTQVNLVSNASGNAPTTDPNLINAWGIARSSGNGWSVGDNATGVATFYDGTGVKNSLTVTIPINPNNKAIPHAAPTGVISNGSQSDFLLSNGSPAIFIFATLGGTIAGWNHTTALSPGATGLSTNAVTAVTTTDGSSYTGLTTAYIDGNRYLYVANFTKGRVDVFNNAFSPVTLASAKPVYPEVEPCQPFVDKTLPANYVPFNVQAIGNNIVVTYAQLLPGQPFQSAGPGLGYVDIYTSSGQLIQRLEHGDWFNAPWGVALAPLDFGLYSHHLLIGQFGLSGGTSQSGGYIAAFNLTTGKFDGYLEDASGNPISIDGLWGISFGNAVPNIDPAAAGVVPSAEMYFASGPNGINGGLFGYLKPVLADLVKGSDQ